MEHHKNYFEIVGHFKYCPICLSNDFFKTQNGSIVNCHDCDWDGEWKDMLHKEEMLCRKRTQLIDDMLLER